MPRRAALIAMMLAALATPSLAETGVGLGVSGQPPQTARDAGLVPRRNTPPVKDSLPGLPPPMTVSIVRSGAPGCAPDCPEWIAAQGMIDASSLPKFKKVLASLGNRRLPVLIDSGGGVVDDGLAIGRLIRANGLDVVVAKTVATKCASTDRACKAMTSRGIATGVPVTRLAKCASSCAFVLAGGKRRVVGATAFVGVHQLKTLRTTAQIQQKFRIDRHMVWGVPTETRRTLISEKFVNKRTVEAKTPESAYTRVASYFSEMGVGTGIMPMLRSTPNSSIYWLSRSDLKSTGIATDTEVTVAFRVNGGASAQSHTPR